MILRSSVGALVLAVSASLVSAQPASAAKPEKDPAPDPDKVIAGVALESSGAGYVASSRPGQRAKLPKSARGSVRAGDVTISLPGTAAGRLDGSAVTYPETLPDTELVAKSDPRGGAQILSILGSAAAPTSHRYIIDAGPGTRLTKNDDGSVSVSSTVRVEGAKKPIRVERGGFTPAWAVDASGAAVATDYRVAGRAIVQTVQTTSTTEFPVTADPRFKLGWTGLFVKWSRGEVLWLTGLGLTATGAAVATLCTGPHLAACVAAVASIWYTLKSLSDAAVRRMYRKGYRLSTRLSPFVDTYWERR